MKGKNLLGGIEGPRLKGEDRARWLNHARAWRIAMKPVFDRMDALGLFVDSPPRRPAFAGRRDDASA